MNKYTLFYLYNQASCFGRSTTIALAYMSTNQIHSTHLREIYSANSQMRAHTNANSTLHEHSFIWAELYNHWQLGEVCV